MAAITSLVELCFRSVAEHLEYNSEAIKLLPIDLTERLIAFMVDRLHPRHLVMTQTRAIKIKLDKHKRSKTFRFLLHGTTGQAIKQIYDKTEDSSGLVGLESYGLFQPAGSFRKARWLQENRTLSYYDIDPGVRFPPHYIYCEIPDVLDFKSKETTIKIKFLGPWEKVVHPLHVSTLNNTMKTFIVDESKPVSEIAKDIARKLGLKNAEEFSLKRLQQGDQDAVGIWLTPDLTLPEQGIDPLYTTFLLKRQFYFSDEKISTSIDPDTLHYFFCQCLDSITAVTHPCTMDEAVLFAALQCQICFGDYNPHAALDAFRLKEFLPLEYLSYKNIEREIMLDYQKLIGMTEEKAKFGYIQLTKSLKSYLYTFFRVEKFINKNHTKTCLLGISADTVLILDAETKETIDRHPFTQIRKWQVLHSFFSLYLPDQDRDKEEYLTEEAETISQVLYTYIKHSLRDTPALQKRFDAECDSITRVYSRRKLSTEIDLSEYELGSEIELMEIRKCPLYVEPKKIYINPVYGNQVASFPNKEEDVVKLNKFVRIIRMLSELSKKMIRSIKGHASKEREILVKFSDKKVKSFVVNEKRTVRELSTEIGRRLGIKNTDEFSLQIVSTQQFSSFNSTFDDDTPPEFSAFVWLIPNQTLAEQEVPENAVLLYKKKFYYNDAADDCTNDPVYFNLLFCQARDAIISNMYTCNKEEAMQLAATLFQINFGDHNPNIHKPGFLKPQDLRFFLPVECLEAWSMSFQKVEKLIYKEHRKLRGIKEVYAKFRYVQLCRTLKTFGAIFFPIKQQPAKDKPHPLFPSSSSSLLLGFSRKCIIIVTSKAKKFILETPLAHLRRWGYSKTNHTFTLDFGDYPEGCISFFTTEGEAVSFSFSFQKKAVSL